MLQESPFAFCLEIFFFPTTTRHAAVCVQKVCFAYGSLHGLSISLISYLKPVDLIIHVSDMSLLFGFDNLCLRLHDSVK